MGRKFDVMPIPEWALCALANGDFTGLTDDEIRMVNTFTNEWEWVSEKPDHYVDGGIPGEKIGESTPYFTKYPQFGLACDVVDCYCRRRQKPKRKYEIRRVDAWGNEKDGYEYNETWHLCDFETRGNIARAFKRALNKQGVKMTPAAKVVNVDGSMYEAIVRKTGEPCYCAIPEYN